MKYTPLLVFIALCVALAFGLTEKPKPDDFVSKMIGQKIEPFRLSTLDNKMEVDIPHRGKFTIINIFASWCESCQAEHTVLMNAIGKLEVIGIAWKDKPEKIETWLAQRGNPYKQVLLDEKGKSTLPLALTGVPETFVIDKNGVVVYNKKAPIDEAELKQVILPLVEKLRHE